MIKSVFNRTHSTFTHVALFAIALASTSTEATTLTTAGSAVLQNFNGMSGATGSLPAGFTLGSGASPTWAGGTTATTQHAGTTGTGALTGSSAGGLYRFVDGVLASSTDSAPGFLTSGSVASPRSIMLEITNSTGATLSSLNLSWNYEKYRTGTRQFDMTFFRSTDGSTWVAETGGDQLYTADGANAVVNPATSISKSITISGLSIAPAGKCYLRWNYAGSGGSTNAQGIGLDNVSVTGIAADTTPPTATLNSAVGSLTNSSFGVSVTLSESSTNFVSGDITTSNASISSFSGSGTSYSFTVNPTADGAVSVHIPVGAFSDAASNNNTVASNTISTTYDGSAPTSSLVSPATKVTGDIQVTFSATDSAGVAATSVYTRQPGGSWQNLGPQVSPFTFTPTGGTGLYYFQAVASDNAGNVQTAPSGTTGNGQAVTLYNAVANGPVTLSVGTGTTVGPLTFPMKDGENVLVTLNNVTVAGTLQVSRTQADAAPLGYTSARIIDLQYLLTPAGGLAFDNASIVFPYDEALLGGLLEAEVDRAIRDNAGVVTEYTGSLDTVGNTFTVTTAGFSTWYLGNNDATVTDWSLISE
jgi:hypothetical protein